MMTAEFDRFREQGMLASRCYDGVVIRTPLEHTMTELGQARMHYRQVRAYLEHNNLRRLGTDAARRSDDRGET